MENADSFCGWTLILMMGRVLGIRKSIFFCLWVACIIGALAVLPYMYGIGIVPED